MLMIKPASTPKRPGEKKASKLIIMYMYVSFFHHALYENIFLTENGLQPSRLSHCVIGPHQLKTEVYSFSIACPLLVRPLLGSEGLRLFWEFRCTTLPKRAAIRLWPVFVSLGVQRNVLKDKGWGRSPTRHPVYPTAIVLTGFLRASSFLGITRCSMPSWYLASILSVSTVLGRWKLRLKVK